MITPAAERPPPGVPTWDRRLTRLIGQSWERAAAELRDMGLLPIRTMPHGGPQDRRVFYSLFNVRPCLTEADVVEEILVPRALTTEERQLASENTGILGQFLVTRVYPTGRAGGRASKFEDNALSVLTDLYVLSFPTYCPTKAKISTYLYYRFFQFGQRYIRYTSRAQALQLVGAASELDAELALGRITDRPENVPWDEDQVLTHAATLAEQIWPLDAESRAAATHERNLRVVIRRLGLHGGPPETMEKISKDLNVSKERVRQIEARFLSRARTDRVWQLLQKSRDR